jgi:hypothetical protein
LINGEKSILYTPIENSIHPSDFSVSVDQLLDRLAVKFKSEAYDVVRCNCNHFTDELCRALSGCSIPEW